ncbi:inovirus-type Gp2 protein, partial [Xanthomonas perforans]|nr:inovirus-type Gp2 protein [Xanthomonas perforans]MBZ3153115.1 inovirus-type Gp2 protein [Xanthomonas perforans]MBZ3174731.1 inovirus-type Gp2 protein [Xanthomonas perforans]
MHEQPTQSRELSAFDASVGVMQAATRRTEIAAEKIQKNKRVVGTSVREFDAAHPIALTAEGQRAALALGLVHYKTTHTQTSKGTVTIEIDPLQARAQRLRKSVITGARLHDEETKKGSFRGAWYFLTLTYADGRDSSACDIRELLTRMRGHFNRTKSRRGRWDRESFRYVWVGELTKRFRPHYHVMLWVPKGMFFGKVDQRGWWPHGSSQIEKARNCVGYLAKYASKFTAITAAAFPKGFRTHGCGGLNTESKRELRWWKAPKDAREALGGEADIRKAKGGWFDRLTGEFW